MRSASPSAIASLVAPRSTTRVQVFRLLRLFLRMAPTEQLAFMKIGERFAKQAVPSRRPRSLHLVRSAPTNASS